MNDIRTANTPIQRAWFAIDKANCLMTELRGRKIEVMDEFDIPKDFDPIFYWYTTEAAVNGGEIIVAERWNGRNYTCAFVDGNHTIEEMYEIMDEFNRERCELCDQELTVHCNNGGCDGRT